MRIAKNLLICVLISFVAIFGFVQFVDLCAKLFADWGLEIRDATATAEQIQTIKENFVLVFITSAIMPPIYEELVFRVGGFKLLRWVDKKNAVDIIITALIITMFVLGVFFLTDWFVLIMIVLAVVVLSVKAKGRAWSGGQWTVVCVQRTDGQGAKIPDIYIILITAVVFMVYHHSWSQTVYQLMFGVVFAIIYMKTGNVGYTMLIHFINNAFVIIYTYYNSSVEGATRYIGWGQGLIAVGLAILALGILYNLIKEFPNGKEK
jgi:membrane protease YdiL (CAAX protease family)